MVYGLDRTAREDALEDEQITQGHRFLHAKWEGLDGKPAVCEVTFVTPKTVFFKVFAAPGQVGREGANTPRRIFGKIVLSWTDDREEQ